MANVLYEDKKVRLFNREGCLLFVEVILRKATFMSFCAFAVFTVASCSLNSPKVAYQDIVYSSFASYSLDVGSLEIVETYEPPLVPPYVEHLVPISPGEALRRWASHTLRPVGESGTVRVTISKASMVGQHLDVDQDFKSIFTREQAGKYTASIEITIDILDERRISRAYANAEAEASATIFEDATLAERDKILFELINTLLQTVQSSISPGIEKFLFPYLN